MNVLIPKLTKGGSGEKIVRKEVMVENEANAETASEVKNEKSNSNGPTSQKSESTENSEKGTSKSPQNHLVNYSDSSSGSSKPDEEDEPCPFDMEVDEDGAPKLGDQKKAKSVAKMPQMQSAVKKRSASRDDHENSSSETQIEPKKPKLTLDEALEGKKSPNATVAPSVNSESNSTA